MSGGGSSVLIDLSTPPTTPMSSSFLPQYATSRDAAAATASSSSSNSRTKKVEFSPTLTTIDAQGAVSAGTSAAVAAASTTEATGTWDPDAGMCVYVHSMASHNSELNTFCVDNLLTYFLGGDLHHH
jgi:hypothetical protein